MTNASVPPGARKSLACANRPYITCFPARMGGLVRIQSKRPSTAAKPSPQTVCAQIAGGQFDGAGVDVAEHKARVGINFCQYAAHGAPTAAEIEYPPRKRRQGFEQNARARVQPIAGEYAGIGDKRHFHAQSAHRQAAFVVR